MDPWDRVARSPPYWTPTVLCLVSGNALGVYAKPANEL